MFMLGNNLQRPHRLPPLVTNPVGDRKTLFSGGSIGLPPVTVGRGQRAFSLRRIGFPQEARRALKRPKKVKPTTSHPNLQIDSISILSPINPLSSAIFGNRAARLGVGYDSNRDAAVVGHDSDRNAIHTDVTIGIVTRSERTRGSKQEFKQENDDPLPRPQPP
jgi:hypothetical protein